MNLELELQIVFNDLDTILCKDYSGIKSDKFIKIVDDTKEDIKNKKQLHKILTLEVALIIDKAFDEYLDRKR